MQNVEIKARCEDLQAVHDILVGQSLKRVSRMRQVDTYFHCRDGRLKLREIDGGARVELIGYRRPDHPAMRTSVYSIAKVADVASMRAVLSTVMGVHVTVAKTRDLYKWEQTRVHLDAVDGLGTFVELETQVYGEELGTAERECMRVFTTLGLQDDDVIATSYSDMLGAVEN